jgi:RNA polymerase sigma factor (sigma-70 family)
VTLLPWRRAVRGHGGDGQSLTALIRSRVSLRFSVTAERLAERIAELAAGAGADALDHAGRLALDDLYLATACADGDGDAWAECERLHFAFIRRFAQRFLPDAAARDLADQTIADLWQRGKIGNYAARSSLRTWIGAVVAHAAINVKKAPHPVIALDPVQLRETAQRHDAQSAARDAPADRDAARLLSDLVSRAVATLSAEDKLLLQLHYEQGLTLHEMEGVVGSSKATLSRRLKRVREEVKTRIDQMAETTLDTSVAALRERLTLDRLEFDLSASLRIGVPVEKKGPDSV